MGRPEYRVRKHHNKTRTGCLTCKARRIKCDEGKPHCKKCHSAGWNCEYAPPSPSPSEDSPELSKAIPIAIHLPTTLPSISHVIPSPDIKASRYQRRGFHYFRSRNIAAMAGNCEPYFWNKVIYQMSHQSPVIQQALTALGTVYEEGIREPGEILAVKKHHNGLMQYNLAIKLLAYHISSPNPDMRITLVSCLLFVWIEFLQNRRDAAFEQMKAGLAIMRNFQTSIPSKRQRMFGSDSEDLFGSLDRTFTRLEIQATIHGTHKPEIMISQPTHPALQEAIPVVFTNIADAQISVMRESRNMHGWMKVLISTKDNPSFQRSSFESVRSIFLTRLNRLRFATTAMRVNVDTMIIVRYIEMYTILIQMVTATIFTGNEMVFDGMTDDFQRLVNLAESLLPAEEGMEPAFAFDMGVIPPLRFATLKCRVRSLRFKALSLLRRAPVQEGMWRRNNLVSLCEGALAKEEACRLGPAEGGGIPVEARMGNIKPERRKEVYASETKEGEMQVPKSGYRMLELMADKRPLLVGRRNPGLGGK